MVGLPLHVGRCISLRIASCSTSSEPRISSCLGTQNASADFRYLPQLLHLHSQYSAWRDRCTLWGLKSYGSVEPWYRNGRFQVYYGPALTKCVKRELCRRLHGTHLFVLLLVPGASTDFSCSTWASWARLCFPLSFCSLSLRMENSKFAALGKRV